MIEKAKPLTNQNDDLQGYVIFCPGCQQGHLFHTVPWIGNSLGQSGPVWKFNGDIHNPTFSPSMLVNKSIPERRCHSFVREGKIQFLGDCFHDLKNQTVELPSIDNW